MGLFCISYVNGIVGTSCRSAIVLYPDFDYPSELYYFKNDSVIIEKQNNILCNKCLVIYFITSGTSIPISLPLNVSSAPTNQPMFYEPPGKYLT